MRALTVHSTTDSLFVLQESPSQKILCGAAPLHPAEGQLGPAAPSRRGIGRGGRRKNGAVFHPPAEVPHCTDPCLCHDNCCRLYLCLGALYIAVECCCSLLVHSFVWIIMIVDVQACSVTRRAHMLALRVPHSPQHETHFLCCRTCSQPIFLRGAAPLHPAVWQGACGPDSGGHI